MDAPQPMMNSKRISPAEIGKYVLGHWRDYVVLFLMGGIIVAFDQWTKALVRTYVPIGSDWLPSWLSWLQPVARIRHWYNSGAAFGFFQSGNIIFTILAIIVSCVITYYFPRVSRRDWWLRLAMGLQLGGALGNLVDRLFFRQVTDFISVGNFAVFNVADSSITVGVTILIVGAWITDQAAKKRAAAAGAAGEKPPAGPATGGDEAKGE